MVNPDDEIVVIVNDSNEVIANCPRREMRAGRFIHRATYILVFNSSGELLLQKRTLTKDIYPGYFDIAAGGVVLAGETYEQSARRELFEELGIGRESLTFHFDHYYGDRENKVWGRVFSCIYDGPLILQETEVENAFFVSLEKAMLMSRTEPLTPDGIAILERFVSSRSAATMVLRQLAE